MATEQVIEERVLDIFKAQNELMAEEVFPLYEEQFGETSRSNSIHTTISRLTKKNFLYVVRRKTSLLTGKTVNVWKYNDGSIPVSELPQLVNEVSVARAAGKEALGHVPAVVELLKKLDVYFAALPEGSKQEVLHYDVNTLLEKLSQ